MCLAFFFVLMHVLCKFKPTKNAQFELPVVNSVMVSDFENEIFCFTATDIICGTCRWYGKRGGGGGREILNYVLQKSYQLLQE